MNCNNNNLILPQNYIENCTLCKGGSYLKTPEKKCIDCPDGRYFLK